MGETASSVNEDCGILKIEKCPTDISEDQWIPTDSEMVSKQHKEIKLIKNSDRRIRAKPTDYICDEQKHQSQLTCICGNVLKKTLVRNCYGGGWVSCNACAESVSDYHSYDESDDETGDENTVYHCSNKKDTPLHDNGWDICMKCAAEEKKKMSDDEKEYNLSDKHEIYNIVRLKMEYSPNCHKIGTGVIIHHTLNRSYVLTAAHNIVELDEDNNKKLDYAQAIWVEITQNTDNGFEILGQFCCCNYEVHPKYIKYLQTLGVKESETGYDIAVIEVLDPTNELRKIKPVRIPSYQSKVDNTMNIKVIGYPGEKQLRGELYGMSGYGEVTYVNEQTKCNKLIAYYDIDTTAGQSGCPIFKVNNTDHIKIDDDLVIISASDNNIYRNFDEIVGIHVAAKQKKKLNFGTLLNDEIIKWIHQCVNGDCSKYQNDMCPVNVLLITSSKSKYSWALNKIYEKCMKTKMMNTRILYFDYVIEQTVNKQEFLSFIRQMFKEKKQSYLIFYCGESDANGNWKINNNASDNITLDDIFKCAQTFRKKNKLFIVSDCNRSGNWVKRFSDDHDKYHQCLKRLQASSKENESCKAGIFMDKYAECCFRWSQTQDANVAQAVGGVAIGVLGGLTVGTLYDSVIKLPYHKASKKSQPSVTGCSNDDEIGVSTDDVYELELLGYNSWYEMDLTMTGSISANVGSAGYVGLV